MLGLDPNAPANAGGAESFSALADLEATGEPSYGEPDRIEAAAYVELYKDYRQVAFPAQGSTAIFKFEAVQIPFYWFVERIFVRTSGATTGWFAFVRDVNDTSLDYSDAMDFSSQSTDIADENHEIVIRGGQHLRIRAEGTTAGDNVAIRVQFSVRRIVQVSFPARITVEAAAQINSILPGLITAGNDG